MAVKLLDLSSLRRDIQLHPGFGDAPSFVVSCRYLSRPTIMALGRNTTGLSDEEVAGKWAEAVIVGWTGLTVAVAHALNVPFDDTSTAADGFIPYESEAAKLLWLYGDAVSVENKLTTFAFRILETVEKEKIAAKNALGASSAPSTTP